MKFDPDGRSCTEFDASYVSSVEVRYAINNDN